MSGNPLVAPSIDTATPFSGTFLLEDGEMLCTAIANGDWVSGGLAVFSAALDGVSFALDPLGSLISMGLGWVIDHIEPIKGWFNDLTGDAGEVSGFASTWQNIAAYLGEAAGDLQSSLSGLTGFQGASAEAFRAFHADTSKHLAAAGQWSSAIGTGMEIASAIVQMVHDMTRDAITTIIGTAASAATTTVVTLGFGAPYAVAQVTSKVASLSAKLVKFVTRLLSSIKNLTKLIDDLVALFKRLGDTVSGALRNVPGAKGPDAPTAPRGPGGPGGPGGPDGPGPGGLPPGSRGPDGDTPVDGPGGTRDPDTDGPGDADPADSPSQLEQNRAQGAAYGNEQAAIDAQRLDGFQQEITIRVTADDGTVTRFRIDGIGVNPETGRVELIEYKSSQTARLTDNQREGFPIFLKNGGEVVGAGKGDFVGGVILKPIQVEIRRPPA